MSDPVQPTHPLVAVLGTVLATVCFVGSAQLHGFWRGAALGVGLVLLAIAIVLVTRTRLGAAAHGWLPSRDGATDPARRRDER